MAVVNVTPDSFSDGGRYLEPADAITHAKALAAAGADILDIGAESTRPGAPPVSEDDETARIVPVIRGIRAAGIKTPISIDTTKAAVARAAVAEGADAVNDISALGLDPDMATTCADLNVPVVLMHMQGTPSTMQDNPVYGNVVGEVSAHLSERVRVALDAGIRRNAIALDPGIGFGKTTRHNLLLLKGLPRLAELGFPLLVGSSRKSFIGQVLGIRPATEREWGTAATVAWAVAHGAGLVRVHAADEMGQVVRMTEAIRNPS